MSIFNDMIKIERKKNMGIVGLTDEFFCVYLNSLLQKENKNILVVVNSLFEANKLFSSLSNYTEDVYLFPMDDFLTSEALAISPDLQINRLETLDAISSSNKKIIITNLMGYLRFLPTVDSFKDAILSLKVGMDIDPKIFAEKLINIGYKKETLVTNTGEFGVRGYVIDVFAMGYDNPIRIEFFGDTIDSIRAFDNKTQKSIESLKEIIIKPTWEFITEERVLEQHLGKQKYLPEYSKKCVSIYEYLDRPITVFKDYNQLEISYRSIGEEIFEYQSTKDTEFKGNYMFSLGEIHTDECIYYMSINNLTKEKLDDVIKFDVKTINNFNEDKDAINSFLRKALEEKKTVLICLKKYQIRSLLKNLEVKVVEATKNKIYENEINLIEMSLNEGFIYDKYVVLTAKELFLMQPEEKKYKTRFKYGSKITDITKLEIGDYVVHSIHGIGIYNGIKELKQNNLSKDYIEVIYKDKDKLYIPVEKIDHLNKYSGKEGVVPSINKLGGTDWQKTKSRVKSKVADMANKLINLYAEREKRRGFAFSKDTELLRQFENDFPYELTIDQKKSLKQIKENMESIKPMDMLLCGDVGFGKTEVAFVAAFKAILDSKQVLFLCPTTILSNQHYENAKERFKNFPVSIGLLNRFTTTKEKNRIIEGLKNGTIDLVFGTHRLLSDDIKPKDLGLLIVDEEQRFGVAHKEKIKEFKTNVDVLTLTATPIPRTLQMSITGIRSLSLIETPPVNRYPVQTYVIEENNQIIKDAIYKELSRNGQVFILYNKVETIEQKTEEIKKLIPDAKVRFAHGQMTKIELEDRMLQFTNKEYDILICTTIIETGIDIPNVNTLIILDADRFGLSQLYQIRGRVGRSNKFAYAYLMYKPSKVLTETAIKRLNVIKEFTELGSGFSIATRDLSIRGAGDILGSEQAGFIDSVGVDLYLKMLNDEVSIRQGKKQAEEEIDRMPLLNVSTHIEDKYVSEDDLKIEIHRLINTIDSKEKLLEVKTELEDRFGKISNEMDIYMHEEWFEKMAEKIPLKKVRETKNSIELVFEKEVVDRLDTEELFMDAFHITPMFRFIGRGNNLIIVLDTIKLEKDKIYYLVSLLEKILNNLK